MTQAALNHSRKILGLFLLKWYFPFPWASLNLNEESGLDNNVAAHESIHSLYPVLFGPIIFPQSSPMKSTSMPADYC